MSVNIYNKDPAAGEEELTCVATKGRNRVWTGTKEAASTAMLNGDIGNGTVVYITNDYDEDRFEDVTYDNLFGGVNGFGWSNYSDDIDNAPVGRVRVSTAQPHSPSGWTWYILDTIYYNDPIAAGGKIQIAINTASDIATRNKGSTSTPWTAWKKVSLTSM